MRSLRQLICGILWFAFAALRAQTGEDTTINVYQLGELVVHGRAPGLEMEGFIDQVMNDTTFQHAFLNTKFYAHHVKSELNVRNKHDKETAYLFREGRLTRNGPMAQLVLDTVRELGRLRERDGDIRFLTAEMYDDVFFPKGSYRASNRIASRQQEISQEGRFQKYKSELKKFMFNPGQEIASVPFVGDKLALFDPKMEPLYDFTIASEHRNGHACWLFAAAAKDSINGKLADDDATVIKKMRTWFDQVTMQVIAREYRIAHESLLLDFDISIEVDNAIIGGDLVPTYVHYDGLWDIPFKKPEIVRFYLAYSEWKVE